MTEEKEIERSIGRLEGKLDLVVSSVEALRISFENLEKGRLSHLEIAFASLKQETVDRSRNMAVWTSLSITIVTYLIFYFLKLK